MNVHDKLRPIPGKEGLRADVKGIQVNDVDFGSVGRGIRIGLSLRGVEPKDIERSHWLDDGSLQLSDSPAFEYAKSPYYRQVVDGRDLHVQLAGETVPAKIQSVAGPEMAAKLPWPVPVWDGARGCVVDLNGGSLRVAGGLALKF